jgi:hypothetical protein
MITVLHIVSVTKIGWGLIHGEVCSYMETPMRRYRREGFRILQVWHVDHLVRGKGLS